MKNWAFLCSLTVALMFEQTLASPLQKKKVHNVTNLLDKLLHNYDKRQRPNFKGKPTLVLIDIYVRSMGPISELDGTYVLDCYFRQRWRDNRLRFSSNDRRTLSLGMSMLEQIWRPDTYIWNGRASYLHKLTTPNRLVRLSADGSVLYSSVGYRSHEVQYKWTNGLLHSIQMDSENQMSQFEVKRIKLFNATTKQREAGADYSTLEAHFLLKRHLGFFLINFYIPCTLLVFMSWVGLLLNREATGDRITLGVTCVLTMTLLCLDSRSDLPHVEYVTGLDLYIFKCYAWLFLCILEFAVVHNTTKHNVGDPELKDVEIERRRQMLRHNDAMMRRSTKRGGSVRWRKNSELYKYKNLCVGGAVGMCTSNLAYYGSTKVRERTDKEENFAARMYKKWASAGKRSNTDDLEKNSISNIDRAARLLFPVGFIVLSALYWHTYLND